VHASSHGLHNTVLVLVSLVLCVITQLFLLVVFLPQPPTKI
jgi:hypothetical protein